MSTPDSYNLMGNVNFKFEIVRTPSVSYYSQDVILPSLSIDAPRFSTPSRDFMMAGSKVEFDNLNLTFLVDDDLANYLEILSWIMDAAKTENPAGWYSDATLHILSSNLNQKFVINFYNIHPVMLAELAFTTSDPDAAPIQCTCNFAFSHFDILGKEERMSIS